MQQNIRIFIDYIVYKDNSKKKKKKKKNMLYWIFFCCNGHQGTCYRFVEIVTKNNLVSNAGKQYACDKLIKIIMCYH